MEEEQKKKLVIMRIGIFVLMTLILGLWLLNLRTVLQSNKEKRVSVNNVEWQQMKDELSQSLAEVKNSLDELSKTPAASTTDALVDQAAADNLIGGLIKETNKMVSSSTLPVASGTPLIGGASTSSLITTPASGASASSSKNNCPAWINCMPSPDLPARTCQIPFGCEGITQIAY